jgi:hypothetical protein
VECELIDLTERLELETSTGRESKPLEYEEQILELAQKDITKIKQVEGLTALEVRRSILASNKLTERDMEEKGNDEWLSEE